MNRPHRSRRRPPASAVFAPRQTTIASPSKRARRLLDPYTTRSPLKSMFFRSERSYSTDAQPRSSSSMAGPSDRFTRVEGALEPRTQPTVGRRRSRRARTTRPASAAATRYTPRRRNEPAMIVRWPVPSAFAQAPQHCWSGSHPIRTAVGSSRAADHLGSSPHVSTFGTTPYCAGSEPSALSTSWPPGLTVYQCR